MEKTIFGKLTKWLKILFFIATIVGILVLVFYIAPQYVVGRWILFIILSLIISLIKFYFVNAKHYIPVFVTDAFHIYLTRVIFGPETVDAFIKGHITAIFFGYIALFILCCFISFLVRPSYSEKIKNSKTTKNPTYHEESIDYIRIVDKKKSTKSHIVIKNDVTEITKEVFRNNDSITSIIIPNSVVKISDGAFWSCKSLTDIVIPDSVTSIGSHAFWGCYSLKNIQLSNSITEIKDAAFRYCSSLNDVVIPNSVTKIGKFAFEECLSLNNIVIPETTIVDETAFVGCKNLKITK